MSTTDFTKATFAVFSGHMGGSTSGTPVKVFTSFTGSAGGIFSVANAATLLYLIDPGSGSQSGAFVADPTGTGAGGGTYNTPDAAFSDAYQADTHFIGGTPLNVTDIGVVPFEVVANWSWNKNLCGGAAGSAGVAVAPYNNFTSQNAQQLFTGSAVMRLSQISGAAADYTSAVMAVGRDYDSGTRVVSFSETGIGALTSPNNWQPAMAQTSTGTGGSAGAYVNQEGVGQQSTDQYVVKVNPNGWNNGLSYTLSAYNNNVGVTVASADGGFFSGGNLSNMMRCDTDTALPAFVKNNGITSTQPAHVYFVSFLGTSDANNLIAATGKGVGAGVLLNYNGLAYSATAVQQGAYTLWGVEHCYYPATMSTTSGVGLVLVGAAKSILNEISTNTGGNVGTAFSSGAGILLNTMTVQRNTVDGATVNTITLP